MVEHRGVMSMREIMEAEDPAEEQAPSDAQMLRTLAQQILDGGAGGAVRALCMGVLSLAYEATLKETGVVDVVAAVRRKGNGDYWLCRRNSDGAHAGLAGMWEYPGGKIEDGEQLRGALIRELGEEFGGIGEVSVGAVLDAITYGPYRVTFFEVGMDDPSQLRCHTEARWMSSAEVCRQEHLPSGTIFNARHLASSPASAGALREALEEIEDEMQTNLVHTALNATKLEQSQRRVIQIVHEVLGGLEQKEVTNLEGE